MVLEGSPSTGAGSSIPPWSAAHPYVNLYTHKNPIEATVVGNYRVTGDDTESDIRHIVLDFGTTPFPVLEEIGRAHVCTPVTNAHLVCRLLLEKKKDNNNQ